MKTPHVPTYMSGCSSTLFVRPEGRLTTSVHGSHVHVTVSLRRSWAAVLDWAPTREQEDSIVAALSLLLDIWNVCKNLFNYAMLALFIFLCVEIGSAFMPGGAVERVLGGLR